VERKIYFWATTLFFERIRLKLQDHCDAAEFPLNCLTYGHLFSFIKKEGLTLYTKLRIQNKYQYENKLFQNELG